MRVAHAQAVPDLQRALGKADGARAGGQPVVVVQQQHRLAALGQVDGQAQAHRAGTHHHHRVAHRGNCVLVGATLVVEAVALDGGAITVVGQRHGISLPAWPTSAGRARPSTRAGRGTGWPRRSSASRRTACSGRRSPSGRRWASAPRRWPCRRRSGPCPAATPAFTLRPHVADEVAGGVQAGLHLGITLQRRAAARHQGLGCRAAMLLSVCGQSWK
jgi:hypothetical protein